MIQTTIYIDSHSGRLKIEDNGKLTVVTLKKVDVFQRGSLLLIKTRFYSQQNFSWLWILRFYLYNSKYIYVHGIWLCHALNQWMVLKQHSPFIFVHKQTNQEARALKLCIVKWRFQKISFQHFCRNLVLSFVEKCCIFQIKIGMECSLWSAQQSNDYSQFNDQKVIDLYRN